MSEQRVGNFEAIPEKGSDNFATSIYEVDYDGLLIARCNQNGRYPHQVTAILNGLNGKQVSAELIAEQVAEIERLRAALASPDRQMAIPEGWQLVPKLATLEMEKAAVARVKPYHDEDWYRVMPKDLFRLAWKALLSASPPPPPAATGGEWKTHEGREILRQIVEGLEGVTGGKWLQFHPDYCEEAKHAPPVSWDTSHDISAVIGRERLKLATFKHSSDAAHVDRCSPDNMRAIAAYVASLEAAISAPKQEG